MKHLIAYCGKIGSGKWYCMSQEVEKLKTTGNSIYMVSFADPLKQILRKSFGITKEGKCPDFKRTTNFSNVYIKGQIVDSIYDIIRQIEIGAGRWANDAEFFWKSKIGLNYDEHPEFADHVLGAAASVTPSDYNFHFRRCAQLIGTELGRHVKDSIWYDIALTKIEKVFDQNIANYAFIDDCRFINECEAVYQFGERNKKKVSTKVIGVFATDETRAKRRGLTVEQIQEECKHGSEIEIDSIIELLPPENIINNN